MGGGRSPCCDKSKVKKGPWSPAEDMKLVSFIQKHGHPNWRSLPKQAGLLRCGKSCRLRWINYLRPDVKRGNFTPEEELSIINLHATFGNKWSKIASNLPGRTDNEIKNIWNTHLKKRLVVINNTNANKIQTPSSSAASTISNGFTNQDISSSHHHHRQQQQEEERGEAQNPKVIEASDVIVVEDIYQQPSTPTSVISCNSGDKKLCCSWDTPLFHDEDLMNNFEIPLESEVEFWSMLENIQSESQPQTFSDHDEACGFPNGSSEDQEMEVENWVRLLEDELGLASPTPASQQNLVQDDHTKNRENIEQADSEIWCDQIYPWWPNSPQNFGLC